MEGADRRGGKKGREAKSRRGARRDLGGPSLPAQPPSGDQHSYSPPLAATVMEASAGPLTPRARTLTDASGVVA